MMVIYVCFGGEIEMGDKGRVVQFFPSFEMSVVVHEVISSLSNAAGVDARVLALFRRDDGPNGSV